MQSFTTEKQTYINNFDQYSIMAWHMLSESFLVEDKDLPILHSQFHGCWGPGDERSQGISNYDIYYVEPECFGACTLMVMFVEFRHRTT